LTSSIRTLYLAGPFRPIRNGAIVAFTTTENIAIARSTAIVVARLGRHYPVTPHINTADFDVDVAPDEFYLDGTMRLLEQCDDVLLLPRWQLSIGARAEQARAVEMGKRVFASLDEYKAKIIDSMSSPGHAES